MSRSISVRIAVACKFSIGSSFVDFPIPNGLAKHSLFCLNVRCYWWPKEEKKPDGGDVKFGVNTRNMDPMEILHVNREIDKAYLFQPLNDKTAAHEQDRAKY